MTTMISHTSAQNVSVDSVTNVRWKFTWEYIPGRNHLDVKCAG